MSGDLGVGGVGYSEFVIGGGPTIANTLAPLFEGRAYPNVADENAECPHVVYRLFQSEPVNTFDGWQGVDAEQWQIDVYAWSYAEMRAKVAAVRAVLAEPAFVCDMVQDLYEIEVRQHRGLMLFSVLRGSVSA